MKRTTVAAGCLAGMTLFGCVSTRPVSESVQTTHQAVRVDTVAADSLSMSAAAEDVQFLPLNFTDLESGVKPVADDEAAAVARVKEGYAHALRLWFVDQDGEAARSEYEKTIDALVALGDIMARADDETNGDGFNGLDLPVVSDENGGDDAGFLAPASGKLDSLNWLATGIVENYKAVLELRNEYNETVFGQQILARLSFFDIGLSGLNTYGKIQAPIAKGHALDYVPITIGHERVEKYMQYLRNYDGQWIQGLYQKFGRYESFIKSVLRKEGLPEDLIYVAMIESGFSASAKSRARAVGFWQFGAATARMYGLNVDWWVDERKDLHASTQAAARHLKDLFLEYGDWFLALSAYNAGPGRVNRAIKKNNTRDYWEMTKLPRETKNYVPYFLATATLAKNPSQYGLRLTTDEPWVVDTVTVTECLDLQVIADCVQSTVDSVRDLNPALLRWCTPPTATTYLLKIPSGSRARFVENYAKIPQDKKRSWVRYQVKYGENLTVIANKFGTDMKAIMQANQLKSGANLITGQYLLIPVAPKGYVAKRTEQEESGNRSITGGTRKNTGSANTTSGGTTTKKDEKAGKKKILYKVEAGNTLGEIAEWYNILAQNIRDWNGLYYGDPIYPGQTLTLWVDTYVPDAGYREATKKKAKTEVKEEAGLKIYEVQDNDTLASIARMFGVEVSSIKRWNKLASNTVRVGDKLKIYVK